MSTPSSLFLKLATFLLPSDSETVLGDLAERASHGDLWLQDVATAAAAAWVARFRRTLQEDWIGPVPSFAGASDDRLRRRAAQLRRSQRSGVAFSIWAMLVIPSQNLLGMRGGYSLLPGLVAAVLVWFLALDIDHAERQREPHEQYGRALVQNAGMRLPFSLWLLATLAMRRWLGPDFGVSVVVSGGLIAAAVTLFRWLRRREERTLFRNAGKL